MVIADNGRICQSVSGVSSSHSDMKSFFISNVYSNSWEKKSEFVFWIKARY